MSGKTAALAAALAAWHGSGFHVLGCALAGRAAQELETAAGIPSHTIDRLLAWLDADNDRPDTRACDVNRRKPMR